MKWYITRKPYLIPPEAGQRMFNEEIVKIHGIDRLGHPVIILRPKNFLPKT